MYLLIPARRRILAELILHPYGYLLWGSSVMGIIFYGVTLIIAFIWIHESELAYHPLSLHVV